jgi:DNA-binding CsgD family transcriptional regulator
MRKPPLVLERSKDHQPGTVGGPSWEGGAVVSTDFLQIAENLQHLDPIRTYPGRAAKVVAELANATSYRMELELGEKRQLDSTPPPPPDGRSVALPLRHGRQQLGTLHLYLPEDADKLENTDLRLARWAARALARGLSYATRMNRPSADVRKKGAELQSRLERTPLTKREREVVALLVSGASTRQIADQTKLTVATVHTYLKRIYSKLGVHSRVELVARMMGTVGSVPPPAGQEGIDTDLLDEGEGELDEELDGPQSYAV